MQGRVDEQTRRITVTPGDTYRMITPTAIGQTTTMTPQRFPGEGSEMQGIQYTTVSQSYQVGHPAVAPTNPQPSLMMATHMPPQRPDIQHSLPMPHTPVTHSLVGHTVTTLGVPTQVPVAPTPINQTYLGNSGGLVSSGQQQQQQFQRLKVEDALSYLDQVKLQFGNHPQVYNDFLDIMKEFKSQSIDTPGVINRVSNLFKGHPDLIVGFNTFLPPGYKIEIQDGEHISVHQPGQAPLSIPTGASVAPTHMQKSVVPMNQPPTPVIAHTTPPHRPTHESVPVAMSQYPSAPPHQQQQQPSQPVEFNHAINYVNKIKNRFQGQPEIYKAFLEILHTYQKEQRNLKEGVSPSYNPLTETEVYDQVAKLFSNQKDLLDEFGQFLPDANGSAACLYTDSALGVCNDHSSTVKKPGFNNTKPLNKSSQMKRPTPATIHPAKKMKMTTMLKDISLAEAGKHGTLKEFAFFDQVRKVLRNQEAYDNFLRCLQLFNQEVVSRSELVQLVHNFIGKFPELMKWFKDFLGYKESGGMIEPITSATANKERINTELAMEIDFTTCKRYGASYRALPSSYPQPKCSGRTALCREVLNDTWVSFPSWSEDSTFVTSRKTQYEENIYRCEDERFELDVVLETNAAAIHVLEGIQKKISRMSGEEGAKFRLDNCLGGNSEILHRKAIQRIYGDKAPDIIDGIKKNPVVAVPLVLRRLKAKEEEWREAQQSFNKIWREQNEKYYIKSLDHQGLNFKQNDIKSLRSKSLLNEIETVFDERQEQNCESNGEDVGGAHLTLYYRDKSTLEDAKTLIIHHMKRQTGIHSEDKTKIKQILHHLLPSMFHVPHGEMSDDEGEGEDADGENSEKFPDKKIDGKEKASSAMTTDKPRAKDVGGSPSQNSSKPTENGSHSEEDDNRRPSVFVIQEETYTLFIANNNWYLFLRLHQLLCERISLMVQHINTFIEDDHKSRGRKPSTAIALKLKSPSEVEPCGYRAYFLDMVKSVLDGNLDSVQYEDQLRETFTIHAYIAFTMDKTVQNIVRQLQHIVCDDACIKITQLFHTETANRATGGRLATMHDRHSAEIAYQRRAEQLLADDNCYKILLYKNECKMTIELFDTDHDQPDEPIEVERWSTYMDKFVSDENASSHLLNVSRKPVFLPRNARRWRRPDTSRPDLPKVNGIDCGEADRKPSDGTSRDESGMHILDDTECKFNMNSFKMVYVVNSESYLYKHKALTRARACHRHVSLVLHKKFEAIVDRWRAENVTDDQEDACNRWLMGHGEDQQPCTTTREDIDRDDAAPYHVYHKYRVKYQPRPLLVDAVAE